MVAGLNSKAVLRIQIQIRIRHMFLILLSSCRNSKKNIDSYYFVILFDFYL
jgi:hypothetical protein